MHDTPVSSSTQAPQTLRDTFLVFGRPLIEEPEIEEEVAGRRSGWIGTGPWAAQTVEHE